LARVYAAINNGLQAARFLLGGGNVSRAHIADCQAHRLPPNLGLPALY